MIAQSGGTIWPVLAHRNGGELALHLYCDSAESCLPALGLYGDSDLLAALEAHVGLLIEVTESMQNRQQVVAIVTADRERMHMSVNFRVNQGGRVGFVLCSPFLGGQSLAQARCPCSSEVEREYLGASWTTGIGAQYPRLE